MSSRVMLADCMAVRVDSINRSSTDLSQCSPKVVHPMPTMATRSRMPLDVMLEPPASRQAKW